METVQQSTKQMLAEVADDRAMILDLFHQSQVTLAEIDAAFADWQAAYDERSKLRTERDEAEARLAEAEAEETLAAEMNGVLDGRNAEIRKVQLTAHLAKRAADMSTTYGQWSAAARNASNSYDAANANETIALKRYEMALARAKLLGAMLGVFTRP